MCGCLVRQCIRFNAALQQLGKNVCNITEQPDRNRVFLRNRFVDQRQCLIQRLGTAIQVASFKAFVDAVRLAFNSKHRCAGHRSGERLCTTHAAQSGGQNPLAGQVAAEMLAAHFDKRFISPLHDALAADVDPRTRGHLAKHHQAFFVELAKMFPVGPRRHQVRVGDQHAGGVLVCLENANRLAGLHQQGLVALQLGKLRNDGIEAFPVPGRLADAAIYHEVLRPLGDFRIEIIHEHAQRRLGLPAFCLQPGAGRRLDGA